MALQGGRLGREYPTIWSARPQSKKNTHVTVTTEDAERRLRHRIDDIDQAHLTASHDERVKGERVICPGSMEKLVLQPS